MIQQNIHADMIQGIEAMMASLEDPGLLVEFLTDALSLLHKSNAEFPGSASSDDGGPDYHFHVILLLKNVAVSWAAGGQGGHEKMIEDIRAGIQEFVEFCGYVGYYQMLAALLREYGNEMRDSIFTNDCLLNDMRVIDALFKLSSYIYDYEITLVQNRLTAKQQL